MINKFTSSQEIVYRVMTNLDLQEEIQRTTDWKSWIAEAVEKIGAVTQLVRKVSGTLDSNGDVIPIIEVKDFQAQLPQDLYRLEQVGFSFTEGGTYMSMKSSTTTMDVRKNNSLTHKQYDSTTHYNRGEIVYYGNDSWICLLEHNQEKSDAFSKIPNTEDGLLYWELYIPYSKLIVTDYNYPDLTYMLKPGYIVTSIDRGYLKLSYDCLNLDSDGMPMIPDMESYKEAIYWYILMKLKYPEYLRGSLDERRYQHIESKWRFYCRQAYAEALMPGNADQMESIKNGWLRVYPEINEHDTFYSGLSSQQKIYNKYYGRVY